METSNKLIALGILICSICAISFLVYAKSNMVDRVDDKKSDIENELLEKLSDEDNQYVERLLGVLPAGKLDLAGNHRYVLDPSTNQVTVTGPQYIVNSFKELTTDKFFEAPIFYEVSSEEDFRNNSKVFQGIEDTLFYNIGIKDTPSLLVMIGNDSKVTASDKLSLESLELFMEGNSHLDAQLTCSRLKITSSDNGHIRLNGRATKVDISLEDNSNLNCYGLATENAEVVLRDNSRLELYALSTLSGIVMNNAYFGNAEKIEMDNLIVKDNARIDN